MLYSRASTYRQDEMWGKFARISANVYDFSKDGVYYRINSENEVSIAPSNEVTYGGNKRDAYLPEQVEYNGNTYTVTAIDYKAFYFTDGLNITIPNTVKSIWAFAFSQCLGVMKLELGNSVESIGYGAFNKCYLAEITIPQTVKYIGDSAFYNTPNLRKITVEEGNANSHSKCGWQTFTDHVIKILNKQKSPIVFLLWGKQAELKKELITNPNHLVLISSHPSPFSARRGFFGCNHFKLANEFLREKNIEEIDWRINSQSKGQQTLF